jgi:hypothetical protein
MIAKIIFKRVYEIIVTEREDEVPVIKEEQL